MINPEKIDEWIQETEDRPTSASLIIRFIGNRLIDLTKWNEELQAENIALRAGKKVEEYEERIAALEYQASLLKRQLGGEIIFPAQSSNVTPNPLPDIQTINLLIYHSQGQVLRLEIPASSPISTDIIGHLSGNGIAPNLLLRLLAVTGNEELLFAFDSGRTVTMPVSAIPPTNIDTINWERSFLQPPLGTEELAFLQLIARMSLSEFCVQVSRKGCVKKIKESLFESYLGKSYIGTGIKSPPDKTCELVFSGKNDHLVLVSKEGFVICLEIDSLPTTIEEVLRLSVTDHIIAAFTATVEETSDASLVFISQNGKLIQRNLNWLDIAASFKTRGQAAFSQERREAGVRLAGAALVREEDWVITLRSDGVITFKKAGDLIRSGNLLSGEPELSILGFTTFRSGF